ncbi:MAG: hypothetical protein GWP19_16300 [Planctomycetia bacterium]|nr:hypothetical protein [Planctomycetia bacterium]
MQKSLIFIKHFFSILILSVFILSKFTYAQSTLDCSLCHADIHNHWVTSHHADTQNDVAGELAEEWAGLLNA